MHKEIRKYILDNFPQIKEVYQYGVNPRDCEKPCVIIQTVKDIDLQKGAGYSRLINMYVLMDRTSFDTLDILCTDLIDSIDKTTIDSDTKPFTLLFNGFIKSDGVDAEYNLIFKTIRFNVLSLYKKVNTEVDSWLVALKEYIENILPDYNIYTDVWPCNFKTPCVLIRISDVKNKKINMSLISNKKTITCHVVANTETEIFKTLETISNSIVTDFKIPYNIEDKTFMTLDDKSDSPCLDINKYSDPYVKGQLKIRLSRILKINKTGNTITSIKRSDFYLQ